LNAWDGLKNTVGVELSQLHGVFAQVVFSLLVLVPVLAAPRKPGDTWRGVLAGLQLTPRLQGELETALVSLQDPGGLGAGQTLTLFYESAGAGAGAPPSPSPSPPDDRLVAADYRLTPSMAYHLERVPIGSSERFVSSRLGEPLIVRPTRVEVPLGRAEPRAGDTAAGTLAAALLRAVDTPALAARLSEVLACELDVLAEAQPGDRVRLIVEKHLLGGRFYRYGRLLALELVPRAGARRLRAFLPPGAGPSNAGASPGAAGLYFTETGESLARALCRTPLLWTRAPAVPSGPSSPGAQRPAPTPQATTPTRPSLHAERSRLGLDYAASPGTPVVALAAGKVSLRGPRGLQGLTVVVTHTGHAGGMETSYQHLGRLARGLTEGALVRPRHLLGYVGQTGDARKPHLHVSLRVAGRLVDPTPYLSPSPSAPPVPAVRQRTTREAPLPESRRAAFAEAVSELSELLLHADDEAPALVLQQRPAESP
jgi:murein DD-endopeptidase MepM/ murein hydrolase activator NlpD